MNVALPASAAIGNPFAAFLLGIPDTTGIGLVNTADSNGRAVHYAVYAQDDWKASSRLTLNYGMRWEYHPPFVDRLNNIAVVLPDVYSIVNGAFVRGAVAVPDLEVGAEGLDGGGAELFGDEYDGVAHDSGVLVVRR